MRSRLRNRRASPERLALKPPGLTLTEAAPCPLSGDTDLRAFRYLETGRARGKVVVEVAS